MKTKPSRNRSDSITIYCSMIRRKSKRLKSQELSSILDDIVRELNSKSLSSEIYLNSLNKIVHTLNSNLPSSLIELNSHYFFILIRNTIRDLLQQLCTKYELNQEEIYLLRNCVLLLLNFIRKINDISTVLHWITDITFLDSLANCLYKINKIDRNKLFIKQISRLVNIFGIIQERLPVHLHQNLFIRLYKPIINCLISSTYIQLFKNLKTNSDSFTSLEKLFLIKCPYFIINYNGPYFEKPIQQTFKTMLPHYIVILDKHIRTIKDWHHPMMHSMHFLLTTINFAKGSITLYINNALLQLLIHHLLRLLNEPILINNSRKNPTNPESLIINTTLMIFSSLIYEPDAFDYIKQCKPAMVFRQLISLSCEKFLWNSYVMFAYTLDENYFKTTHDDLIYLLYTIVNLLHSTIEYHNDNINRNLIQLTKILKHLMKYEQAKNEILKHNVIPFLIQSYEKLNGLSKQYILESLWTLSFNKQAAEQMRENPQFINSLQNILNSTLIHLEDDEIYKISDGLIWNLVKESQYRENKERPIQDQYDIMLSYSHQDKDIVDKIQQFLINQGFNIWFNTNTPLEQTMGKIDNSALILLCLSDSYKQDNSCRSIAEYTFTSKRFILPLIVHKEFKYDAWLTSIINQNMFIDFSNISDFKKASSLLIKTINQHHKTKLRSITPINIEQPVRPSMCIVINRQQEQIIGHVIPRSTTPVKQSNSSSAISRIRIINGTDRIYLPEKYLKRDTSKSTYRFLPINIWNKSDLLDFLYDLKLNQMMPLCESMTDETLIEFFRMCHTKPARLYKQLNEYLRHHFKGYILPITVYTKFLIEIDHLLDSVYDRPPSPIPLSTQVIIRTVFQPPPSIPIEYRK